MGFLADKEDQVVGRVAVEGVGGLAVVLDKPVGEVDMRSEKGGEFHGAGKVVDVEGVGVYGGDGAGVEPFDEALHDAGGDVAAVHPSEEPYQQSWGVEVEWGMDFEELIGHGVHSFCTKK